jgi:hypothetical protein
MNYNFYDKLVEETSNLLIGHLSISGDLVKWEFLGLSENLNDEELMEIYQDDIEILLEYTDLEEHSLGEPQIGYNYISFYIEI